MWQSIKTVVCFLGGDIFFAKSSDIYKTNICD